MREREIGGAVPELSGDGGLPVIRFDLRRPPFWTPGFTMTFVLAAAVAISYYTAAVSRDAGALTWHHLLVPLSMAAVALVVRLFARPRLIPPISFFDDHMVAPRSAESGRATTVGYNDIISVDLRGRGGSERLFIVTRRFM